MNKETNLTIEPNQLSPERRPVLHSLNTDDVIDRGWVTNRDNVRRKLTGAVSKTEARVLSDLILEQRCRRCLETGVAYGVSTLAITQATAQIGGHHYGIDPCQVTEHREAALCLLEEHGLSPHFTLLEGPSHIEFPQLLLDESPFDFVFVDGWHTFDFKLLDYFYADKLLRVGGWLVFHDLWLPSVKKVLRFIQTQEKYQLHRSNRIRVPLERKMRLFFCALIKQRPLWYFWPCSFANLLILRKTSSEDSEWNHFKSF